MCTFLCVCVLERREMYHRCSHSRSLNVFTCTSITIHTYAVHLHVLWSPGAVGARLLSGQNKPVTMDVDEEENMSESTLVFFPHFSVWAIASISFQMPACIFVSLFSARMPSLVCLLPPLLWCVISVKTFYSLIFPSMSVLRLHFIKREIQYNIKLIKLEQNLCILFDEKKNSTVELRKCDKNKD